MTASRTTSGSGPALPPGQEAMPRARPRGAAAGPERPAPGSAQCRLCGGGGWAGGSGVAGAPPAAPSRPRCDPGGPPAEGSPDRGRGPPPCSGGPRAIHPDGGAPRADKGRIVEGLRAPPLRAPLAGADVTRPPGGSCWARPALGLPRRPRRSSGRAAQSGLSLRAPPSLRRPGPGGGGAAADRAERGGRRGVSRGRAGRRRSPGKPAAPRRGSGASAPSRRARSSPPRPSAGRGSPPRPRPRPWPRAGSLRELARGPGPGRPTSRAADPWRESRAGGAVPRTGRWGGSCAIAGCRRRTETPEEGHPSLSEVTAPAHPSLPATYMNAGAHAWTCTHACTYRALTCVGTHTSADSATPRFTSGLSQQGLRGSAFGGELGADAGHPTTTPFLSSEGWWCPCGHQDNPRKHVMAAHREPDPQGAPTCTPPRALSSANSDVTPNGRACLRSDHGLLCSLGDKCLFVSQSTERAASRGTWPAGLGTYWRQLSGDTGSCVQRFEDPFKHT